MKKFRDFWHQVINSKDIEPPTQPKVSPCGHDNWIIPVTFDCNCEGLSCGWCLLEGKIDFCPKCKEEKNGLFTIPKDCSKQTSH